MQRVKIADRFIGDGCPVFIVAEAGSNHNGDLKMAMSLIDVAVSASADAVKFQIFKAESLCSSTGPKSRYQQDNTCPGQSYQELLKGLQLDRESFYELKAYAESKGIIFFATPFDDESVDFLVELGVPAFKVGSGDTDNLPLISREAKNNLPMIISTGMSTLSEIEDAIMAVKNAGNNDIILMHATSAYPASYEDVNLRAIGMIREAFGLPVGYSDHTISQSSCIAAVALGAVMIEKHITLDRNLPGPDHFMSCPPDEFKELVRSIREVELALGKPLKRALPSEMDIKNTARKSITAKTDIPAGAVIEPGMLCMKRPGTGISSKYIAFIVGRTTKVSIPEDSIILPEMLI